MSAHFLRKYLHTYNDLATEDPDERLTYLWSLLYTTGYLTDAERTTKRLHKLVIPNMEVQQIFEKQIRVWFNRSEHQNFGWTV